MVNPAADPAARHPILDGFGAAVDIVNPAGRGPVVLVCEHASWAIPPALAGLGLSEAARRAHVAWDIGAEAVARHLARYLDAPLVLGRVSRLVHDCNRPPGAHDAMPVRSEAFDIPGNAGLDAAARAARAAAVHAPFHAALAEVAAARPGAAMVSIHSFTPVWHGRKRSVQLGLLHGADDRLARAMLPMAQARIGWETALNQPYGPADGVLHTLDRHAGAAGALNAMVELRNDLISDEPGQAGAAEVLFDILSAALANLSASPPGRAAGVAEEHAR